MSTKFFVMFRASILLFVCILGCQGAINLPRPSDVDATLLREPPPPMLMKLKKALAQLDEAPPKSPPPPSGVKAPPKDFHHLLPPEELVHYFGTSIRKDVPEYVITSPKRVKEARGRRSVTSQRNQLEYHVTAFGQDYKLVLQHNDHIMSPGCIVEKRTNGSKQLVPCFEAFGGEKGEDNDCHYFGVSEAHNGSTVAVSTCNGLHGIISIPDSDHDLIIQPVKSKHSGRAKRSTGEVNPHIIFKRQAGKRLCEGGIDHEVEDLWGLQHAVDIKKKASLHSVTKRSTNDLNIEMLLVADKTLYELHGDDLKNFLLTIANVASARLQDPSLGHAIRIRVVKIQILETDEPGLEIVEAARYTLKSFCDWQEKTNPAQDSDPQHYDAAVLFTKLDLTHGASGESTVGLATTGGMCAAGGRCMYVEETGVDTGLTLAHETGHSLGIGHDGDHNSCSDHINLMSSSGAVGSDSFKWSSCSKAALDDFINSGRASCLTDTPTQEEPLPKDLPGVLYDEDDQCRLWVGTEHVEHPAGEDPCRQLHCTDPNNPSSWLKTATPMMDGSMCGTRKWCINAQCVDIGPNGPPAVDGGWSDWPADWSECSRTCGGGIMTKTRKCDNPKPRLGGRHCQGESTMAELCNVKACSSTESKFKEDQCEATRDQPISGQTYDWIPWNARGAQECYLMCMSKPGDRIYRRTLEGSNNFKDGTTCVGGQTYDFYRCVRGTCQAISCDGHVNSTYKFDKCGVCGGAGNQCTKKSGTKTQGEAQKWSTITKLPKGSTGIHLSNKNRFAKMSISVGGTPIFNDNPTMSAASDTYSGEGVTVVYRQASGQIEETLDVKGPLQVDAEAQVYTLYDDAQFQPNLVYEFYLPDTGASPYEWRTENTECNVECGGGNYHIEITCRQKSDNSVVEDKNCNIFDKPDTIGASCNTQACPPFWRVQPWEACSKDCGGGTQTRSVECVERSNGQVAVVASGRCPANRKPSVTRTCNVAACSAGWQASDWSSCSMTCGQGVKTREVTCMSGSTQVAASNCVGTKPESRQACVLSVCDTSLVGDACNDANADCADYDLNMCKDYGDWARANCKMTCSFCTKSGTTAGSGSNADCQDKTSDCTSYGTSICTGEYAAWANSNCAKFCGLCQGKSSSSSSSSSSSTSVSSCEDKTTDCTAYGQTVCTGEYADWARENCPKFCGHCGSSSSSSSSSGSSQSSSSSSSSSNTNSGDASCVDASSDCPAYGKSVCTGDYAAWATTNCASYCGHCTSAANEGSNTASDSNAVSGSSDSCEDKTTDCTAYGQSVCTGEYASWAKANCPKFCSLCGGSSGQTSSSSGSSDAGANTDQSCVDASSDCAAYGQSVCTGSYADWAKANCAKSCGHCGSAASSSSSSSSSSAAASESCEDKLDNCAAYGSSVCSGSYAGWARENCRKMCAFCADSASSCEDQSDCTSYGMNICTDYGDWAKQTCPKKCGFCSRRRRRSATPHVPVCEHVMTSSEGKLDVIGQLEDQYCNQMIVAPLGQVVSLMVEPVDLSCDAGDSLRLVDMLGGAPLELCDATSSREWKSTSNNVAVLLFTSELTKGYRMVFNFEPADEPAYACSQQLTDPTGQFSSPEYPNPYPGLSLCETVITAPIGYKVQIYFNQFDLEDSEECQKDSVMLLDIASGKRDQFCGHQTDLMWRSTANMAKIVFASDRHHAGKGFWATYTFVAPW